MVCRCKAMNPNVEFVDDRAAIGAGVEKILAQEIMAGGPGGCGQSPRNLEIPKLGAAYSSSKRVCEECFQVIIQKNL
jgi:hypothetical protein